jgi:thiol-disulfide isomerase/thioredoxin
MRLTHICLLSLASIFVHSANGAWAKSPYAMEGVVTDADTQAPVANTTVQVLITSEPEVSKRVRKSVTDEDGRYSVELPAGHAWAWWVTPPDGYCTVETNPTELFATTDEQPIFTKNYQVRQGVPIKILVQHPDAPAAPAKTYVAFGQQKGSDYIHAYCELDGTATGTITLPQLSGRFNIYCADEQRTVMTPDGMAAEFEEGFDPRNVISDVKPGDDGTLVVRDANRRACTLTNCDAVVTDNQLVIVIHVEGIRSNEASTKLTGRVIDVDSKRINGAAVTLSFHSGGGSASSQLSAITDKNGEFAIGVPRLNDGQKIGLVITREGFGGVDTDPMDLADAQDGIVSVGAVTLQRGCSIRIRVVGPDGKPLHGAVVEPLNDYASRTRIARTGPDGECQLTDLAAGLMRVSAQFGTLATSTKIPLDQGANEVVVLKLAPTPTAPSSQQPERPPPLAAGTPAPEWTVAEWTDGKDRTLADYRGKVVVLDFWGIWCGPCVHAIPAMKELHRRYKDRDVVFLGIHTAGTDMTLVKRLLKQQDWDLTVGLDSGDDIVTGETVRRYSIQGYPSVIVVDRSGVVAFSSDDVPKDREAFMRDMEAMAKSAGLPWPIDKDATEEEAMERMTQLQVFMFSREIDEALETQAD